MRARVALAALVTIGAFAVAPATAGPRKSPPPLKVAANGKSFNAAIGTYSWCYEDGDQQACVVADGAYPPKSGKALAVDPGDRVVLRPHAKVKSIEATFYDFDEYPNQPKPVPGKHHRVWTLKVANGLGKRKDLLLGVQYRAGNSAQFGFGIRRAESSQGLP
jgi:hypothetical protein